MKIKNRMMLPAVLLLCCISADVVIADEYFYTGIGTSSFNDYDNWYERLRPGYSGNANDVIHFSGGSYQSNLDANQNFQLNYMTFGEGTGKTYTTNSGKFTFYSDSYIESRSDDSHMVINSAINSRSGSLTLRAKNDESTITLGGELSGDFTLNSSTTSALTHNVISGSNPNFTGLVNVTSGALTAQKRDSLSGNLKLASETFVNLNAGGDLTNIQGAGQIKFKDSTTLTINNDITFDGGLNGLEFVSGGNVVHTFTKLGTGMLTLQTGNSFYSVIINVNILISQGGIYFKNGYSTQDSSSLTTLNAGTVILDEATRFTSVDIGQGGTFECRISYNQDTGAHDTTGTLQSDGTLNFANGSNIAITNNKIMGDDNTSRFTIATGNDIDAEIENITVTSTRCPVFTYTLELSSDKKTLYANMQRQAYSNIANNGNTMAVAQALDSAQSSSSQTQTQTESQSQTQTQAQTFQAFQTSAPASVSTQQVPAATTRSAPAQTSAAMDFFMDHVDLAPTVEAFNRALLMSGPTNLLSSRFIIHEASIETTQQFSNYRAMRRQALLKSTSKLTIDPAYAGFASSQALAGSDLAQVIDQQTPGERMDRKHDAIGMGENYNIFARVTTGFTRVGSSSDRVGLVSRRIGTVFGFDMKVHENIILGFAGSYNHNDIGLDDSFGKGDVDSFRIGPYGLLFKDQWFIESELTFGIHANRFTRYVEAGPGRFAPRSSFTAWDFTANVGGGYDFLIGQMVLTARGNIQYQYYGTKSFDEKDGQGADLHVDGYSDSALTTRFGLELSQKIEPGFVDSLTPFLNVGWRRDWLSPDDVNSTFIGGGDAFRTTNDLWSRDSIYFGCGTTIEISDQLNLDLRYQADIGDRENRSQNAYVSLRYQF